jgi:hypothetical protein
MALPAAVDCFSRSGGGTNAANSSASKYTSQEGCATKSDSFREIFAATPVIHTKDAYKLAFAVDLDPDTN